MDEKSEKNKSNGFGFTDPDENEFYAQAEKIIQKNEQRFRIRESFRQNLHYLSTVDGAEKVAHFMTSMVMDTHKIIYNFKKLKNKDLNLAGIIAGLLLTTEFNNTIDAISAIIDDLSPKEEESAEENTKESSEDSAEEIAEESSEDTPLNGFNFADINVKIKENAYI